MSQEKEQQWTPEQIAKALEGAMTPVVSINGKKVAEVALITAEATGNVITVKYFLKS